MYILGQLQDSAIVHFIYISVGFGITLTLALIQHYIEVDQGSIQWGRRRGEAPPPPPPSNRASSPNAPQKFFQIGRDSLIFIHNFTPKCRYLSNRNDILSLKMHTLFMPPATTPYIHVCIINDGSPLNIECSVL